MKKCDCNPPKALEIKCPGEVILFRKVEIPAEMGDDVTYPPRPGMYRNVLLVYKANNHVYMYSSDGMPTMISDGSRGVTDYEELENKPSIDGYELIGDVTLEDIGVVDAIDDALEDYTPTNELADVALSGDYDDLINKPTIPVVNDATLTVKRNNESVGTFTANSATNTDINITVPVTAADVHALPDSTKYGASIVMSINTTDYKVTTTLKDQDGNTLGTAQVIDLPLESVVVNGSYDSANKKIILTLQNGNTIDIPVGDLISGLQTEITSTNMLSADLVDDTSTTHKFTTAADISKLAGIETGAEVNVQSNWNETNSSSDAYIQNKPSIPTKTSDLTNDGADNTSTYVEADELATVATSGSYSDLINKPTIPTVNDATLTIQRNSTTVGTFTANASQGATVDIAVPTKTSDLNNDSGFITSASLPTKTSDLTNDGSDGTSTYVESDDLATVATSGSYNDLSNKPTIPAAQVNSDWNAASGVAQILNKPNLATVATSGSYNDLTDKPTIDFELVEMSYGESNAWAKFIAAYQGHKIVYCRASSNSNPASGSQTRKAFMAYVNNADNPTEVEFQYVRSVSSKTSSQPVDQVFVYKLTSASGGTWTVQTRDMGPKLASGTNANVSYSNGTYTISATQPTVNDATLTIQKNGTNVATFTANASSNVTANIAVPTATSDLTNDSGFITSITKITNAEIDAIMGVS